MSSHFREGEMTSGCCEHWTGFVISRCSVWLALQSVILMAHLSMEESERGQNEFMSDSLTPEHLSSVDRQRAGKLNQPQQSPKPHSSGHHTVRTSDHQPYTGLGILTLSEKEQVSTPGPSITAQSHGTPNKSEPSHSRSVVLNPGSTRVT